MPPNKIDWDKISLEELLNNPLVFSVVCGIFGLYFILVLWARRADRKDLEKVGGRLHCSGQPCVIIQSSKAIVVTDSKGCYTVKSQL